MLSVRIVTRLRQWMNSFVSWELENAEDAGQNAMLSAYLYLRNFEGHSAFTTWFTRIVFKSFLPAAVRSQLRPKAPPKFRLQKLRPDDEPDERHSRGVDVPSQDVVAATPQRSIRFRGKRRKCPRMPKSGNESIGAARENSILPRIDVAPFKTSLDKKCGYCGPGSVSLL